MRVLTLLLAVVCGTSCLRPSCVHRVFGPPSTSPNAEHFATLTLYSEPIDGSYPPSTRIRDRFESGAFITIDGRGSMAVSTLDLWPRRCPTIPKDDLLAVSQQWQPVLEQIAAPLSNLQVTADQNARHADDTLLSLQVGPVSGKNLGLLWDGRSSLPDELETAVMATLEMVCSNSQLAKKYLLRDLPRQVASQLECR